MILGAGMGKPPARDVHFQPRELLPERIGDLVIKAIRGFDGTWTSARLVTSGHFSQAHGTFSARIKFPGGAGMWPAFWLLGDNGEADGEIDVVEAYGNPNWGGSSSSVYSQNDVIERTTGDTHAGTGWHLDDVVDGVLDQVLQGWEAALDRQAIPGLASR